MYISTSPSSCSCFNLRSLIPRTLDKAFFKLTYPSSMALAVNSALWFCSSAGISWKPGLNGSSFWGVGPAPGCGPPDPPGWPWFGLVSSRLMVWPLWMAPGIGLFNLVWSPIMVDCRSASLTGSLLSGSKLPAWLTWENKFSSGSLYLLLPEFSLGVILFAAIKSPI